jgi:uncharacterized protein YcnI
MRNRLTILFLLLAGAAQAHVMLSPSSARPGAQLTVQVEVGHGCSGAPTTELQVHIPASVTAAVPQPKPGWTAALEKAADGGRVAVWRGGRLAADKPDTFALMLALPRAPGQLRFPATQICGQTRVEWNTPAPGAVPGHPAPVLSVSPTPMAMPGMANMPPM